MAYHSEDARWVLNHDIHEDNENEGFLYLAKR